MLDWSLVSVCELLLKSFPPWGSSNIVRLRSNAGRFFPGTWLPSFLIESRLVTFIVHSLRVLWFRVYVDSVENLCLNSYICYPLIFIGEAFTEFLPLAAPIAVRIACGSETESHAPESGYLWLRDMNYTGGSSGNLTTVSRIASQLDTVRYFELSDGNENCYNVSVPNGQYLIRYSFSQLFRLSYRPDF